jgi:hypothetical protein
LKAFPESGVILFKVGNIGSNGLSTESHV